MDIAALTTAWLILSNARGNTRSRRIKEKSGRHFLARGARLFRRSRAHRARTLGANPGGLGRPKVAGVFGAAFFKKLLFSFYSSAKILPSFLPQPDGR
jgi:hypothetical protein